RTARDSVAASLRVIKNSGESDPWNLPPVPWQRRQAILAMIEKALAKHGVRFRSASVGSRMYCAVHGRDVETLHAALASLGKQWRPARLRVWLGRGSAYQPVRSVDRL